MNNKKEEIVDLVVEEDTPTNKYPTKQELEGLFLDLKRKNRNKAKAKRRKLRSRGFPSGVK